MPKQKAVKTRGKRQEDLIDVSGLQSVETYDAPANKESGTKKKKKARVKQEEETLVFMEESPKNRDSDEDQENSQGIHHLYTDEELKDTVKRMCKNKLLNEYFALKEDYSQMQAQLQKKLDHEREKNEGLTEELEQMKCQAEVPARQHRFLLDPETAGRIRSLEDRVLDYQQHNTQLKAKHDAILEEIKKSNALKEEAVRDKKHLSEELEELKHQLSLQKEIEKENKELKERLQTSQEELNAEHEALLEERKKINTLEEAAEEKKHLSKELEELQHQLSLQKSLQEDFKELEEKFLTSQEELRAEKEKSELLQKTHEELGASFEELSERFKTEVSTATYQTEISQSQTLREVQSCVERAMEDRSLIETLKSELESIKEMCLEKDKDLVKASEKINMCLRSEKQLERMLEELKVERKNCQEELQAEKLKNQQLREELSGSIKDLSSRLDAEVLHNQQQEEELSRLNNTVLAEVQAMKKALADKDELLRSAAEEIKTLKGKRTLAGNMYLGETAALKPELRCMSTAHSQAVEELNSLREVQQRDAAQHQENTQPEDPAEGETEVPETATPAQPSLWKRFRHAVGLRKPERWKRRREASAAPLLASESSTRH